MPVKKYADAEQARRDLWVDPGDPDLARRIRGLWEFSGRLAHRETPKGVLKFRSMEEANAERASRAVRRSRS
jgi:hypothetical protein